MAKKSATVTEQLRAAIVDGDESRYALSMRTGINASVLCRFVAGGPLKSETIDVLCDALGLELKPKRTKDK